MHDWSWLSRVIAVLKEVDDVETFEYLMRSVMREARRELSTDGR